MALLALLAACGGAEPDGEGSGAAAGLAPPCETLVVVALDGLRLDDPWKDPEVAPHLAALAQRSEAVTAATAVGSPAGLHAGWAALLSGLEPWESGAGSVHDAGGHGLPDGVETWPEELVAKGWRASAIAPLPHLRRELNGGLHQGFEPFLAPALEPGARLDARQVEALAAAEWGPLLAQDGPLALVLGLADLAQETLPDPADALLRVRAALAPHLERLPHVAAALEEEPAEALDEVARLLGRARGAAPYLAWRNGLREARLAAVDRTMGAVLRMLEQSGREERAALLVVGLRGAPLAPPASGPRAAFLPELTRVPLLAVRPPGSPAAELTGVWTPGRTARLARALCAGGLLPAASPAALVMDGLGERFAAFGPTHHVEERARVQRATWASTGDAVLRRSDDSPELVSTLDTLDRALDERPAFGWALELAAGSDPVDVRWRALSGFLAGDTVMGVHLREGSVSGVTARARLVPTASEAARAELRQGRRTQDLLLTLGGVLPERGPWSQGALLLDAGDAGRAGGEAAAAGTDDGGPEVPSDSEAAAEPAARVRVDSGWARAQLAREGSFSARLARHPGVGDAPPLDWSIDARLDARPEGTDALLVTGADPALLALALPPRTELGLALRTGDGWIAPWEVEGPDGPWGSQEAARVVVREATLADALPGAPLRLVPLRPAPAFGPPLRAPAHLEPFLRRLPPSE